MFKKLRLASRKKGFLIALSPGYCVLGSGRAFRRAEWHLSPEQLDFNLKSGGARDERCVEQETWWVVVHCMQERSNRSICYKKHTQNLQDRRLVKKPVKIVCISKRPQKGLKKASKRPRWTQQRYFQSSLFPLFHPEVSSLVYLWWYPFFSKASKHPPKKQTNINTQRKTNKHIQNPQTNKTQPNSSPLETGSLLACQSQSDFIFRLEPTRGPVTVLVWKSLLGQLSKDMWFC